jgi:hypothetical protein
VATLMNRNYKDNPPIFAQNVTRVKVKSTIRDLYLAVVDVDNNPDYIETAFDYVEKNLDQIRDKYDWETMLAIPVAGWDFTNLLDRMFQSIKITLNKYSEAWPRRVAEEYAPVAHVDGAWLHGPSKLHIADASYTMPLLKSLMIRFGDPSTNKSVSAGYDDFIASIGIAPGYLRSEPVQRCSNASYHHAAIGLCLGLFPQSFLPEIIGFNYWRAKFPVEPLLTYLNPWFQENNANLAVFKALSDASDLVRAAADSCRLFLESHNNIEFSRRIAHGYALGYSASFNWNQKMQGEAIPMSTEGFVAELMRNKALHAKGNHDGISMGGCPLDDLIEIGGEKLLKSLKTSSWINPGFVEKSKLFKLMTFDGPMFEIFSARQIDLLKEWVKLGCPVDRCNEGRALDNNDAELLAPQSMEELDQYCRQYFQFIDSQTILFQLINADRFPLIRLWANNRCKNIGNVSKSSTEMGKGYANLKLLPGDMPPYSETVLEEIAIEFYQTNINRRPPIYSSEDVSNETYPDLPPIAGMIDGFWLQGFVDISQSHREEYSWLFKIYASELGDGEIEYNHTLINRRSAMELFDKAEAAAMAPATDIEFYLNSKIEWLLIDVMAMNLKNKNFVPELLALNFVFEAEGVGGTYFSNWKNAVASGRKWTAVTSRLHNSIDNFSSGHTQMAISSIKALMERINDTCPDYKDEIWKRIWGLWRLRYPKYQLGSKLPKSDRKAA